MFLFFKKYKIEIIIFALAILVRVFLLFINLDVNNGNFEATIHGSDWYFEVSQNLHIGNGFSLDGASPSPIHVPVYPYFLALSLFLFGNYIFAVIMQIIIGAFIPILAMRISSKIIDSRKISLFVGFFLALELNFVLFSFIFFTETIFIFLFLLSMLAFIRYLKYGQVKYLLIFTALLGVATLTKTVVQFYPLFILPIMWWFMRKHLSYKALITHSIILIGLFVIILSPWMYRNYKEFKAPGMTIMPSLNLYATLVPSVLAVERRISFNEARKQFIDDRNIDLSKLNFSTASEFNKEAFGVLKAYPMALAKVSVINILTFFTHDGMLTVLQNSGFTPKESLSGPAITLLFDSPIVFLKTVKTYILTPFVLVLIMRIFWILTTISFFVAVALLIIRKKLTAPIVFVLVTVLYLTVTTPSNGLTVNSRFRMPVTPIILTLAAYPFIAFRKNKYDKILITDSKLYDKK
jgi:4-amino-4-deoxy-L-arabinose transferase-like glycosyltransferase